MLLSPYQLFPLVEVLSHKCSRINSRAREKSACTDRDLRGPASDRGTMKAASYLVKTIVNVPVTQ